MKYPVYALRGINDSEVIGELLIIHTYYRTYVLDDRSIPKSSFKDRRVLMLNKGYPYPIYPINRKCDNPIQVNNAKKLYGSVKFIDDSGELLTYIPDKRVTMDWKKPKYYRNTEGSAYLAVIKGEPYHFTVSEMYPWVGVITFNGGRYIIKTSFEEPKRKKTWTKI